jgi:hypothetical protein
MTWLYKLLFVSAAWCVWGFVRKEIYYRCAKPSPETKMPVWLARTVTGIMAAFFGWLAFLQCL